jgi:hypothetical protein
MTELLLVGMFTAFFLAVLKPLIKFLSILGGGLLINAGFALAFSSIPVYLVVPRELPVLAVWTTSGAFLGSFLLAIADRIATHRPAVINPARPE